MQNLILFLNVNFVQCTIPVFFMAKQISLDSKGQRVNTIFGLPLYPKSMDKKNQERENLVTILELLKRLAQQ